MEGWPRLWLRAARFFGSEEYGNIVEAGQMTLLFWCGGRCKEALEHGRSLAHGRSKQGSSFRRQEVEWKFPFQEGDMARDMKLRRQVPSQSMEALSSCTLQSDPTPNPSFLLR